MIEIMPKWFDGKVYSQGAEVTNEFSGETCTLNCYELSVYDFIIGCDRLISNGLRSKKIVNEFNKGLTWFRKTNPKAYLILLD